ncbi:hypothetical protein LSUB1_G002113, partial [Lachnellula subtilissima]
IISSISSDDLILSSLHIAMVLFSFIRLIKQLSVAVLAFAIFIYSSPVEKRATQVSSINYNFSENVLSGSINIQNIAFSKVVTLVYAMGNTWSASQSISASYSAPGSSGYETWVSRGLQPAQPTSM